MTTLKNKIEAVHASDINKTLRSIGMYTWIGAGALFACYIYLVGSLTFSFIQQRSLEENIKTIVSDMSREELVFLSAQKHLTLSFAQSLGLTEAQNIAFISPARAFAINVGR